MPATSAKRSRIPSSDSNIGFSGGFWKPTTKSATATRSGRLRPTVFERRLATPSQRGVAPRRSANSWKRRVVSESNLSFNPNTFRRPGRYACNNQPFASRIVGTSIPPDRSRNATNLTPRRGNTTVTPLSMTKVHPNKERQEAPTSLPPIRSRNLTVQRSVHRGRTSKKAKPVPVRPRPNAASTGSMGPTIPRKRMSKAGSEKNARARAVSHRRSRQKVSDGVSAMT